MENFLDLFYKCTHVKTVEELEVYAKENKVPIINPQGLMFLLEKIYEYKPKRVLEIGTAIGYSSILMSSFGDLSVSTIERNSELAILAKENIHKAGLDDKITVITSDALELDLSALEKSYDMIFIDAAKAQYQKFFEKYEVLLNKGGIIICDNLAFHGLVSDSEEGLSKNLRGLVRKIKNFKEWLKENKAYDTRIYDSIGDGMSISIKK